MGGPPPDLAADIAEHLDGSDLDAYARFAMRTRSPLALRVLRTAGHTATLGRVTALGGLSDSHARGLALLDDAVRSDGVRALPREALSVWTSLLLRAGRDDELREVLADTDLPLTTADRWTLRTDLANPHRTPSEADSTPEALATAEEHWLRILNEVHEPDGLDPVELLPATAGGPYQRLTTSTRDRVDGDLVTVVMSAYKPGDDLLLAVRGVLEQTWSNIELLIVDDASGPESDELLARMEGLDPRVRIVRAPRNGGTYQARNLALTLAEGRWMTFQDSDDWTHPRRVEHQVNHLLEFPKVLGNRTWTLRAYPDLTMTFVGYLARRLNASSLLFDRQQVTRLVGSFDATRKSGDMELPLRLRALRPGSVRDLSHPSPLAITQLRAGSLSRDDALPGWTRWDRLAYRDSYLDWHRQVASGRMPATPPPSGRPFPLPRRGWHPNRDEITEEPAWEVVVLGDMRPDTPRARRTLGVARLAAHAGLDTAVAHAEAPRPLAAKRVDLLPELSADVRLGRLGVTNAHESDTAQLLVVTTPESLLHLDEAHLRVRSVLVVTDEAEAEGWSVAAVEARCHELFGVSPLWGGAAAVHDGPGGPSPVRSAVPDAHWCGEDLPTVAGAGWLPVGGRPRARRAVGRPGTVVVGHHLDDAPHRWPTPAPLVRTAYPAEVTDPTDGSTRSVEVHCLDGLTALSAALGRRLPPPTWLSFAGTGMTTREYLSHIDVWVYLGSWDEAAEHAALEALGAGLPCIVGEDAAGAGLPGTVRCVPPEQVRTALEQVLDTPATHDASTATRESGWTAALRQLVDVPDDAAPHDDHDGPATASDPTDRPTRTLP